MVSVYLGEICDTKIVDCEREGGTTLVVTPKARSETNRCIALGCKMGLELVVGKDTCFLQTVHSFANFKVGVALGVKVFVFEIVTL